MQLGSPPTRVTVPTVTLLPLVVGSRVAQSNEGTQDRQADTTKNINKQHDDDDDDLLQLQLHLELALALGLELATKTELELELEQIRLLLRLLLHTSTARKPPQTVNAICRCRVVTATGSRTALAPVYARVGIRIGTHGRKAKLAAARTKARTRTPARPRWPGSCSS